MNTAKSLNTYLANTMILNVKLHNLHWNVLGQRFVQLHNFTEALYDDFFEKYDDVAELLKMKGEKPLARMVDYLKEATVEESDQASFTADELLAMVSGDLKTMKELAIEIRSAADEAGDFDVVAMMEDHVAGYSKNLWFLSAMMAE